MNSFRKYDKSFICINCRKKVNKLIYSSRDHCPFCLYSIHIDYLPGDRKNKCKGILEPINLRLLNQKMQIEYICKKCKYHLYNIVAKDDDKKIINKISSRI